jgi:hypothetical protein
VNLNMTAVSATTRSYIHACDGAVIATVTWTSNNGRRRGDLLSHTSTFLKLRRQQRAAWRSHSLTQGTFLASITRSFTFKKVAIMTP